MSKCYITYTYNVYANSFNNNNIYIIRGYDYRHDSYLNIIVLINLKKLVPNLATWYV